MPQIQSLKTENKFKKTEIGEIPVDWNVVKLSDVCSIRSGEICKYSKDASEDCTYPVYGSNGIVGFYEKFNFDKGLIVGRVGASGSVHRISSPIWATDNTLLLLLDEQVINKDYLYYSLLKANLPRLATQTAQPLITQTILKPICIPHPPLAEQTKIAEILSTVDAAIEKIVEVIEKTKQLKKGLMHQLLTRGIGHKKFKETEIGELPETWRIEKMEDVVVSMNNGFVGKASPFYSDEREIPYLMSNNVRSNKLDLSNLVCVTKEFHDAQKKSSLNEGNLLTVQSGHIGTTCVVPSDVIPANCHALIISRLKREIVDPYYLSFCLNFLNETGKLTKIFIGTTVKHINVSHFKEFKVPIPSSSEQNKITEILLRVDEEIEKETAQKTSLENLKKGLMQVLLNGKVRVK